MKIRNGFVSNSSSSSFTCDVCGNNVSGMDMGLHEAEMFECVAGHTFCESHAIKTPDVFDTDEKRRYLVSIKWDHQDKEFWDKADEVCVDDAFDEASGDFRYEGPSEFCPCCTLAKITSRQLLEYLLQSRNVTKEDIEKEIRSKYHNYEEMKKDFKK